MLARRSALALLLLLTLLQGIAPLLHAHVGGHPATTGVHAPFLGFVPGVSPPGDHAAPDERREVGVGTLIERRERLDPPAVLPPPVAVAFAPPARVPLLVVPAQPSPRARLAAARTLTPPAQAPPRAFA